MILNSPTISGSLTVTGNIIASGSITLSGSVASASFATSASNATNAISASYANNLTVAGTLTAQTLVVQTITSSVNFVTGSTRFGSLAANTHTFTGSIVTSGSMTMTNGDLTISGNRNIYLSNSNPAAGVIRFYNATSGSTKSAIGSYFNAADEGNLEFLTGGTTTKMIITSVGNVGIGTTTPTDIAGYTSLTINNNSNGPLIDLNNSGTNNMRILCLSAIDQRIYGAGALSFYTSGSNRMSITSAGNVGIGTSSPNLTSVNRTTVDINGPIQSLLSFSSGGTALSYIFNDGYNFTLNTGTGYMNFQVNGSERMRIGSTASQWDLMIGTTSVLQPSTGRASVSINGSANSIVSLGVGEAVKGYVYHGGTQMYIENSVGGGNLYVVSGGAGGVTLASGASSWTATSDERLKNINSTIENAVDKLSTLRTVNFSWKSDSTNKENLGLIAQDVEKVFPQIVDKDKLNNGANEQTDHTEYLGVRYTEMVPVLVKAIQELKTQNDALQSRIETLESK